MSSSVAAWHGYAPRLNAECVSAALDHITSSTINDSKFCAAKRRLSYTFISVAIIRSSRLRRFPGDSAPKREVGGIWRAAPAEDENYVYSLAL